MLRSRHAGIAALVTVILLSAWVGFLPAAAASPGARFSYNIASNTYTVLPSGGDDTATLQAAFDACSGHGPACTIQLGTGTFHTAQIVVHDFRGTFQGMGEAQTIIEALPDLPVGNFVNEPASAENPWPSLFTFFDGRYTIRHLTFVEPWETPLQEWEVCDGCAPIHALFALVSVTGLHAKVVADHVTMIGGPGDFSGLAGAPILYNVINGIFPQALVLAPGQTDFSGVSLFQVDFTLTNSAFYFIDNPSAGENLVDSRYVARYNTLDTVEWGFWFTDVSNSVLEVSQNVIRNEIFGTGVIAYQNLPYNVLVPCQTPSYLLISGNDIQFTALANGVVLIDLGDAYGCERSLNAVVAGNTFRSDETSAQAVLAIMMPSVTVSGNEIMGATLTGVAIWYGPAVITDNEIRGAQFGIELQGAADVLIALNEVKDSWYIGILVYGESSGSLLVLNEVKDSGLLDLAWDLSGTDNFWIRNECQTSDPVGLCTGEDD